MNKNVYNPRDFDDPDITRNTEYFRMKPLQEHLEHLQSEMGSRVIGSLVELSIEE